jgi:hypothetical protein
LPSGANVNIGGNGNVCGAEQFDVPEGHGLLNQIEGLVKVPLKDSVI